MRTAQTTAETISTDNSGSYATVTPEALAAVEKSIPIGGEPVGGGAWISAATGEATGYTVTATAGKSSGNTFTITNKEGVITRTCTVGGKGGCPLNEKW